MAQPTFEKNLVGPTMGGPNFWLGHYWPSQSEKKIYSDIWKTIATFFKYFEVKNTIFQNVLLTHILGNRFFKFFFKFILIVENCNFFRHNSTRSIQICKKSNKKGPIGKISKISKDSLEDF